MIEVLSSLSLAAVVLLLLLGLDRQFRILSPRGQLLDRLVILPQWKFFGQSRISTDPNCFDDLCLLARISPGEGKVCAWQDVLWWEDRPITRTFWNPLLRSRSAVGEAMQHLTITEPHDEQRVLPTSLAYLTVLRHCLDCLPPGDGMVVQFAIATTRGRENRPVFLRFLSAWHTP
jgi:hypothetical protein